MFFLEFAENGSIYDYIHKKHMEPTLKQSVIWAKEVTEGKCLIFNAQLLGVTTVICPILQPVELCTMPLFMYS